MPFYLAGVIAFIFYSGFVFYKGYEYKSDTVQAKVLKIENIRLREQTKALTDANKFATNLNKTTEATNKSNQEIINELQKPKAPTVVTVKSSCADVPVIDGGFLRTLGTTR